MVIHLVFPSLEYLGSRDDRSHNKIHFFCFQAKYLSDFTVTVSEIRPSNQNSPNNNPDFPVCHQHEGYPTEPVTVYCKPGPRWGRYVSVYANTPGKPLHFCEVEVYEVHCKCWLIECIEHMISFNRFVCSTLITSLKCV